MIPIKEIGWLAGLIEGEGCITGRGSPTIILSMTDKDVVDKVGKLFNKIVYTRVHKAGRKTVYTVSIHSSQAIEWMFTIYSFMGERRKEKIKEVVKDWMIQKSLTKGAFVCGHPKTYDNIYYSGRTHTFCRACHLARNKDKTARAKGSRVSTNETLDIAVSL